MNTIEHNERQHPKRGSSGAGTRRNTLDAASIYSNVKMLFDFSHSIARKPWQAIDDRVMGGISQSELVAVTEEFVMMAAFRGSVSQQNNGGFCSIRAPVRSITPPTSEHVWIECRNGGQWGTTLYALNLRTSDRFDGISYRASFTPYESLARFELATVEFAPVFRGRAVPDAPALKLADVQQIGLMVADGQSGPFELIISAIGVI